MPLSLSLHVPREEVAIIDKDMVGRHRYPVDAEPVHPPEPLPCFPSLQVRLGGLKVTLVNQVQTCLVVGICHSVCSLGVKQQPRLA